MLGPLPTMYRVLVAVSTVLACMGIGAWLTYMLPGPLLAPTGAGLGAGIGMVVVLVLLHDFENPHQEPRRVRLRTPRHH